MANLNIKNVPDDLYDQLRKRAAENRRSLNSEAIVCLERAVREQPTDVYATLERVRALRSRISVTPLTGDELERAIDEGRP